jgi:hypothetical protein
MTILSGIVLGKNAAPFVMIAADSRSTKIDVYQNKETLEITRQKLISINDNTIKVSKPLRNIIIGFAGNGFGQNSINEIEFIKEYVSPHADLKEAAEIVREKLISRVIETENNSLFDYDVMMGGFLEGKPALAAFNASLGSLDARIEYRQPLDGQVMGFFSGVKDVLKELKDKLNRRVSETGGSITSVRLALEDYIKEAARLFPETCNEVVRVERIRAVD